MIEAKLFPLDQKVRIISRSGSDGLGMSDRMLLALIRLRQDAIWQHGRSKLHRDWDTFAADQGADPFGPHARVEIHVGSSWVGRWHMVIYWNLENAAWAGVHLRLDFLLEWPLGCEAVF